jgi:hypothetical protein
MGSIKPEDRIQESEEKNRSQNTVARIQKVKKKARKHEPVEKNLVLIFYSEF